MKEPIKINKIWTAALRNDQRVRILTTVELEFGCMPAWTAPCSHTQIQSEVSTFKHRNYIRRWKFWSNISTNNYFQLLMYLPVFFKSMYSATFWLGLSRSKHSRILLLASSRMAKCKAVFKFASAVDTNAENFSRIKTNLTLWHKIARCKGVCSWTFRFSSKSNFLNCFKCWIM